MPDVPTHPVPLALSRVALADRDHTPASGDWRPHPKFPGVAMRQLAGGPDTGGAYSLHQVRIDPGCAIETHIHPDNDESHLVLSGHGTCAIAGRETAYDPGVCGVLPKGVEHRVGAGTETLYILATFVPALA